VAFKDLFSEQADAYAKYRPTYPSSLYTFVASLPRAHERAWDCGTGNGQAARGLASRFREVVATDPSEKQLEQAPKIPNVVYRVARAEECGIPDRSIDLVTVAQAFHWFRFDRFFGEVRRVAKQGSAIAIWCYSLCHIDPAVDEVLLHYYHNVVGRYWDPERKFVDDEYRNVPFPFAEVKSPELDIEVVWKIDHLFGYLRSWSATQKALQALGRDPIEDVRAALEKAWGDRALRVVWPIAIRAGKIE
jgi:hypothetical protein